MMMINIRSITLFDHPGFPVRKNKLAEASRFNARAADLFQQAGYRVQSKRYATPSFAPILTGSSQGALISWAQELEQELGSRGFDYLALGPALPDQPASYRVVPALIRETENVFASGLMTAGSRKISLSAVRACGEIIQQLSTVDDRGFANLYFAALGNVPPGAPFFPAAYHDDSPPGFALAIEGASLAVRAFSEAADFDSARRNLIQDLESHARSLSETGKTLQEELGMVFGGIDYSLAPFPAWDRSLGTALEQLGDFRIGEHGSLAAAAFLADTIDQAEFPRTGFSGLMLPLLEDAALAERGNTGELSLKDLLLYSTVCGTGLDTIPLPGELSAGEISAVLFDLAALSCRLNKPLTARLMPIPGKTVGDETDFDFDFFANSRVQAVQAQKLKGLFQQDGWLTLQPREGNPSKNV